MKYQERLEKLRAKMRRKGLDGFLVSEPNNRRYLSGYRGGDHGITESSGLLLIPRKGDLHLLTDGRFILQAEQELETGQVHSCPGGHLKRLLSLVRELEIRKLGFESRYTLHSTVLRMPEQFSSHSVELSGFENFIEPFRVIKDEDEIDLIRESVKLNERIFQKVAGNLHTYSSETAVALAIENEMRLQQAEGPSFSTIVAAGENGASPHAIPSASPLAPPGVTIDMGLVYQGYCSDMTRNLPVGEATDRYLQLHRLVRKAQRAGMAAIRAGVRCCDVDRAARKVISEGGYGKYFCHSLGHGVGMAVHEEPRLSAKSRKLLKENMVVTVEPGIYIPGWGGIRLEEMVVVREDGFENLNSDATGLDI